MKKEEKRENGRAAGRIAGKRYLFGLLIIFYLLSVIILAGLTLAPPGKVFLGMLPFLLFLGTFYFIYHENTYFTPLVLWALPLVFPFFFYLSWLTGTLPALSGMEGAAVAFLNLALSYAATAVLVLLFGIAPGSASGSGSKEMEETKPAGSSTEKVERQNFPLQLRSIEDKCKALNFVIGRVYSNKKGGSRELRSRLTISREWYNRFSEIVGSGAAGALPEAGPETAPEPVGKRREELLEVLRKIRERLRFLEQREQEALTAGMAVGPVAGKDTLPVERSASDSILDVLARNDKDPVREYHAQALEICEKVLEFLG